MRIFDRVATLIKADAHGVVESLEDRGLMLKQLVREAEIELDRKRARVEALEAEAQRLEEDIARFDSQMQDLDEDVTLALSNGKEELARFAIKKLIPLRHDSKRTQARLAEVRTEHETLGERLALQTEELESLKARARSHLAALPREDGTFDPLAAPLVADEDVEMELLRRQREMKGGA